MKYLDKSLPVFTNFTILVFYWHACELSYDAQMLGAVHICLYSKCAKFIRTVPDDKVLVFLFITMSFNVSFRS